MDTVYFILDKESEAVKVGYSTDAEKRLAGLQTASPHQLELIKIVNGGIQVERTIHSELGDYKLWGEWFKYTDEVKEYISELDGREMSVVVSVPIETGNVTLSPLVRKCDYCDKEYEFQRNTSRFCKPSCGARWNDREAVRREVESKYKKRIAELEKSQQELSLEIGRLGSAEDPDSTSVDLWKKRAMSTAGALSELRGKLNNSEKEEARLRRENVSLKNRLSEALSESTRPGFPDVYEPLFDGP